MRHRLIAVMIALSGGFGAVEAQTGSSRPSAGASFAAEAVAASLGSAAGLQLGLSLVDRCGELIPCELAMTGVGALAAAALAPVAALVVARAIGDDPSGPGAAVGSIVGVVAAFAVVWAAEPGRAKAWIAFSVTHGVLTAAGARLPWKR